MATDAAAKILSRRDLDFQLFEWLDAESLTARERFRDHSRSTFDAALDAAARVAAERFYPINRLLDANEPRFDGERVHTPPELQGALEAFSEGGFMSAAQDAERGGMQLPYLVAQACFAWFQGASVGASAYPFLTVGNANLLLANGSAEQIETWVPPMLEGRFFGTMCLSEPQAGSSLSDIRTRAEPQADGSYRVFGTKMWISGAEHEMSENIVHLVLAKIPGGPAGTKGISLFIVPKFLVGVDGSIGARNDVSISGLNHKMGQRGITNTVLNFNGATGYLVGEEHRGIVYMFHMMNEARLGVGMGAVSLGYTGYLKSLQYALERPQGRALTNRDPSSPQVPIIEHADVKRMLLAQKAYAEGALALALYCARLVDWQDSPDSDDERDRATLLLDVLTPVAKSWPSQWCLEANSLAIQVMGGYGYTREYDVEQHYRDNRLNPIHEGTHGIQSLDLLGRKVTQRGGAGLVALGAAVGQTVAAAGIAGGESAELAAHLDATWQRRFTVTMGLFASGDAAAALANSVIYLEAFGHIVIAWMWLEQFLTAGANPGAFYDGKRQAARYFFRYELPRTGPQLDLLEALDRTTVEMRPDWF